MIRTKDEARAWRAKLDGVAKTIDDAAALINIELFPAWRVGAAYKVDERIRYGDKLYKCLQGHTSQSDWLPDIVPALWVEVAAPGQYREIKVNMLSTEAFALGEIGWWQTEDNLYESLIAANVYTPASYPAGWRKVNV